MNFVVWGSKAKEVSIMKLMVFFWQFVEHLHQKKGTLGTNYDIRFLRIPELVGRNVQHNDIWKVWQPLAKMT